MLGRFTAGMLVIALYMLLSVKSIGVRETKRNEELIGFELEYFVEGAKLSGKITSKDYEGLLDRLSFTGGKYMVQIKVGTIVHGISGNYIETAYTEDVLDWLKLPGSSIDVRERMITVYAIPIGRGIGLGLANLIWESVTPKDMFVYGDYIHG